MKQRIKLARTQQINSRGEVWDTLPYVVSKTRLDMNPTTLKLSTEDALLIGWSTEADEGNQYVVGIVLLESRQVIAVHLSSIVFV